MSPSRSFRAITLCFKLSIYCRKNASKYKLCVCSFSSMCCPKSDNVECFIGIARQGISSCIKEDRVGLYEAPELL
jgi:hypothetical protein